MRGKIARSTALTVGISFAIPLQPMDCGSGGMNTIPAFAGENLPSKAVHLWYVKAKKRRIFQGPWQRETLEITTFLFYNNRMRSRGHIAPLRLIANQKNIEKEVKRV